MSDLLGEALAKYDDAKRRTLRMSDPLGEALAWATQGEQPMEGSSLAVIFEAARNWHTLTGGASMGYHLAQPAWIIGALIGAGISLIIFVVIPTIIKWIWYVDPFTHWDKPTETDDE